MKRDGDGKRGDGTRRRRAWGEGEAGEGSKGSKVESHTECGVSECQSVQAGEQQAGSLCPAWVTPCRHMGDCLVSEGLWGLSLSRSVGGHGSSCPPRPVLMRGPAAQGQQLSGLWPDWWGV